MRLRLPRLCGAQRRNRPQGHGHRIRFVIHRRTGGGIHTHADQPAEQNVARKTNRSGAGNILGERNDLRLVASLLIVTVISALRLATTTQGVTQAVGLSSPDSSAVAPAGVDAMEIFSVVPRVTEAQPIHGNTIAAANSNLIIGIPPTPRKPFAQPQREGKGALAIALDIVNAAPRRAETGRRL